MNVTLHLLAADVKFIEDGETALMSIYYSIEKHSRLYMFDSNEKGYISSNTAEALELHNNTFIKMEYVNDGNVRVVVNVATQRVKFTSYVYQSFTKDTIVGEINKHQSEIDDRRRLLTELEDTYYPTMLNGLK